MGQTSAAESSQRPEVEMKFRQLSTGMTNGQEDQSLVSLTKRSASQSDYDLVDAGKFANHKKHAPSSKSSIQLNPGA